MSDTVSRGQTILLADDDLTLAEMYSDRLTAAGYKVNVVHDGEAALAAVAKAKPDLILLDIMMPKLNGLDVAANLAGDQATAGIPVVFLTALIQEIDKVKALKSGAADYFVKSETTPGELVERVAKILASIGSKGVGPAAAGDGDR